MTYRVCVGGDVGRLRQVQWAMCDANQMAGLHSERHLNSDPAPASELHVDQIAWPAALGHDHGASRCHHAAITLLSGSHRNILACRPVQGAGGQHGCPISRSLPRHLRSTGRRHLQRELRHNPRNLWCRLTYQSETQAARARLSWRKVAADLGCLASPADARWRRHARPGRRQKTPSTPVKSLDHRRPPSEGDASDFVILK